MLVENMKKNKTIQRLMKELKNKYIKQGKLSGKLIFEVKNEEERSNISELVSLKYYNYKDGHFFNVNLRHLEKRIQCLLNEEITLLEFLEERFFGEKLTTRKEEKEKKKNEKELFYEELKKKYPDLKSFIDERHVLIEVLCKKEEKKIKEEIKKLHNIVVFLENQESTTLPFLANHLFKDSHAVDIGTTTFQILMHYICFDKGYEMQSKSIEEKNKVLEMVNIRRDEVSNHFLTYNLVCWGDPVLDAVYHQDEIYTMNLKKVQATDRPFEGVADKIFIVENNLVFQRLTEDIGMKATILCSSGQFNTAFLEFLKRMREGTRVFYAGDFDPEGLFMLENIATRVELLFPLLMTKEVYEKHEKQKEISESRLKGLSNLKNVDPNLIKVMQEEKKVLYQEEIYDELLKEIKTN